MRELQHKDTVRSNEMGEDPPNSPPTLHTACAHAAGVIEGRRAGTHVEQADHLLARVVHDLVGLVGALLQGHQRICTPH